MAKKDSKRFEEQMRAETSKEIVEKAKASVFPKIEAMARVKSYERTKDGLKPKFDKGIIVNLTQQKTLDQLVVNEELVAITIQPIQARMDRE